MKKISFLKKVRLYYQYCRTLRKYKEELLIKNNARVDRAYRIYTVINIPPSLIEEPYNLRKEDIDSLAKNYIKDYTTELSKSLNQKNLIKISKISDQFSFLMEKELLVSINEALMLVFDEESVEILIEQEIDKISVNIDTGKIKLVKPDLTTFSSLINKYGIDKIARANKVEELYSEQKQDSEEDFII